MSVLLPPPALPSLLFAIDARSSPKPRVFCFFSFEAINNKITIKVIKAPMITNPTENYPKIHTVAPDTEIMFSMVSSEGLYSSKNRSTLYFDNRALIPCRI